MNNSFNVVNENQFDRNFGGTTKGVADPYISGYHFISFVKIPDSLTKYVSRGDGKNHGIGTKAEIQNTLAASCLSVTPPGGTLNKAEFTGLGGTKFSVPTNIDYGNTITVKFLEYSSLPIMSIIGGWVRMIRDYRTGTSQLDGSGDSEYTKSNYAGSLLYWTTKPDGRSVEFSALYTGVFQTKDPMDLYTGDVTAVDKLEPDIEFNVDWIWHEDWVHDKAQTIANRIHGSNHPDAYRDGSSGSPQ